MKPRTGRNPKWWMWTVQTFRSTHLLEGQIGYCLARRSHLLLQNLLILTKLIHQVMRMLHLGLQLMLRSPHICDTREQQVQALHHLIPPVRILLMSGFHRLEHNLRLCRGLRILRRRRGYTHLNQFERKGKGNAIPPRDASEIQQPNRVSMSESTKCSEEHAPNRDEEEDCL